MTIIFESYKIGSAAIHAHVNLRTRLSEKAAVFYAAAPVVAKWQGSTGQSMRIDARVGFKARLRAGTGMMIAGVAALSTTFDGSTPIPSASLVIGSLPMRASFTGNATQPGHVVAAAPLATRFSSGTLFCAVLPVQAFFNDGTRRSDRVGTMLLQPALSGSLAAPDVPSDVTALHDSVDFRGTAEPDPALALRDLFTVSDEYALLAEALQQLHDGISLYDLAAMLWETGLQDEFIASAVPDGMAQITVMLSEAFDFAAAGNGMSEILAAIADGFHVSLVINLGDDVYTAWVMTPESRAMRSYSNWPFNSYAELGGHFLGASAGGIYRMGGKSDNGEAIRASIRTGLLNFGSDGMKGVETAYVGATTDGDLLLKVRATTRKGQMVEQIYRMTPAVKDEPREHRQPVGRGFHSVYWRFELANDVDGAAFEVTNWHVLPVGLTGKLI